MMIFALALAAASGPFTLPATPTDVLQISCRQGECAWQQMQTIETLPARDGETLVKLTSRYGKSVHLDGIPERYSTKIKAEWQAEPRVDYVLCSHARPTTVFWDADESVYVVTALQLASLGGYEYAGATLYMQVCHDRAPGRWKEGDIPKLGYGAAIRGSQTRVKTLAEVIARLGG